MRVITGSARGRRLKEPEGMDIYIESVEEADLREKLFYLFAKENMPVLRMQQNRYSLEDVFLELTSEDEHAAVQENEGKGDENHDSNS